MYGDTFYHKTIRKYNIMFGTLFNDISIQRRNSSNVVTDTLEVPIAYAPKEEFITLIRQRQLKDDGVQVVLPRMSFEMVGFNYAPDRMQSVHHKMKYSDGSGGANAQYMPVAYDFDFTLHIYAKHTDDNLQILEQILPFFNPTVNWPVSNLPELSACISHDIAIELTGNSFDYDFEGQADGEDRLIVQELNFTLRGYLFRGNSDTGGGLIKTAIVNYLDTNDCGEESINQFIQKTVTLAVNPSSAGEEDTHTIEKTNQEFYEYGTRFNVEGEVTSSGVSTVQRPRTLSILGSVTGTGESTVDNAVGEITISGTVTTSGASGVQKPRTMSISGTVTTSANSTTDSSRTTSMSGTVTTDGNSTVQRPRSTSSMIGVADGEAISTLIFGNRNVQFSGSANTSTIIQYIQRPRTMSITGSVESMGVSSVDSPRTVSMSGTVSTDGIGDVDRPRTMSVNGAVTSDGTSTVDRARTMGISGSVTTDGVSTISQPRTMSVTGTVTTDASSTADRPRTAPLSGTVTTTSASDIQRPRTASLNGIIGAEGIDFATRPRTMSISGTATADAISTVSGGSSAPVIESSTENTDFDYGSGDMIINKPSGVVEGDLMVAILSTNTNTGTAHATPSGWTMLVDNEVSRTGASATKNTMSVMYKVATASEGGSYVFDLGTASTRRAGQIFRISGASTTFDVGTHNGANGNEANALSITTTDDNTLVLLIYAHTGSQIDDTTPNPTIGTIALDTEDPVANGGGQDIKTYEYVKTPAGAVGDETQRYGGSIDWGCVQLGIRPA